MRASPSYWLMKKFTLLMYIIILLFILESMDFFIHCSCPFLSLVFYMALLLDFYSGFYYLLSFENINYFFFGISNLIDQTILSGRYGEAKRWQLNIRWGHQYRICSCTQACNLAALAGRWGDSGSHLLSSDVDYWFEMFVPGLITNGSN